MRFKKSPTALAVASLLAVVAFEGHAQSGTTASSGSTAQQGQAAVPERITITGSRVFRLGFDSLEPATVVTREAIEASGVTNIAEALRVPGFGTGITPEGNQSSFGVGVNFVNRFGLGSNRTLTLINGRRVVSSNTPSIFGPAGPGGQVDLNILPTNMVERVENLAIGGAPTYGSDAIAGVVNIVTRRKFEGFEVNGTYGITQENDAKRMNFGALAGTNFLGGRGNVMISYVYDVQDGLLADARPRGQRALSLRTNPCTTGPSSITTTQPGRTPENDGRVNPNVPFQTCVPTAATDGIPNSVYIENDRNFTMLPGGLLFPATGAFNLADNRLRGFGPNQTTYFQFAPDGRIVPFNPGINFGNTNASGGDGFALQSTAQITSKVERHTVNVLGNVELGPSASLFYEGLFYKAEALELVDQTAYNANLFGGASAPLTFAATHPLLSPAAVATLQANGITSFRLSRVNRDLAVNNGRGTTEIARSVIGANGSFEVGKRLFNWEVSANLGKNDSVFYTNVLNQQNFINALNVTRNASGNIVCTTTPTPGLVVPGGGTPRADPNCVPLNLFGDNVLTPAAKAYVTGRTTTLAVIEQRVFNANIGGTVLDLWAGPLDVNVGFEQRKEKGEFIPDEFQINGLGRAVAILGNKGEYSTKEVFGEAVVPLVDAKMKVPMVDRLVFTGKFRRVDSTVNGVADTYTYGLQFRPVADIEFRGNATRALRAPALTELFTPSSNIFTTVPDPCDSRNVNSGTDPALRRANCAPFYAQYNLNPSTFLSNAVTATIPGTLSGSPTLRNEKSDARNFGVIFRPRTVKGLQVSWDYFEIKIADTISNLNATAIATGCYDNPDPNNSFCPRIQRDAAGQITGISTGFVNGGILDFKGSATEAQYTFDLDDVNPKLGGELTVGVSVSKMGRLKTSTNRVVTIDSAGELGFSKDVAQVSLGYKHKGATLPLRGNYIGPARFNNTESAETRDIPFVNSYLLFSGSVGYEFNKKLRMNLAVTNLSNREPPFPLTAGAAAGIYDTLGRRFSLTVIYKL